MVWLWSQGAYSVWLRKYQVLLFRIQSHAQVHGKKPSAFNAIQRKQGGLMASNEQLISSKQR